MDDLTLQDADRQADQIHDQLRPGALGRVRPRVAIVDEGHDVKLRLRALLNGQKPLQKTDKSAQVMTRGQNRD